MIPFFVFPPPIRPVIYTTNAIESVHARLRKMVKTRGHFPTDEAGSKLIWLALRKYHGRAVSSVQLEEAMNQFAIMYGDHFSRRAA